MDDGDLMLRTVELGYAAATAIVTLDGRTCAAVVRATDTGCAIGPDAVTTVGPGATLAICRRG